MLAPLFGALFALAILSLTVIMVKITRERSLEELTRIAEREFVTAYVETKTANKPLVQPTVQPTEQSTEQSTEQRFNEGELDWKYTEDDGDLDCKTDWDYYDADKKTLLQGNIPRTTTTKKKKKWCATKGPTSALDRVEPDLTTAEKTKTWVENKGMVIGTAISLASAVATISSKIAVRLAGKAGFKVMQNALLGFATKLAAASKQALAKMLAVAARSAGKLAAKFGIKVAAKMATAGASKLAVSTAVQLGSKMATAATGAAAALNGPMMAFAAASMVMDLADVGGYGQLQIKQFYQSMKKTADGHFKKVMFEYLQSAMKEEGIEFTEAAFIWPMVYDPLSDAPEGELEKRISAKLAADKDKIDKMIQEAIDKDLKSGALDSQKEEVLDKYADLVADKLGDDVYRQWCGEVGGFIYEDGKCTLKEDKCSEWPVKDGEMYREFRDGKCVLADATVRRACDDAKLPYDMSKGVCKIDEAYCKSKGAEWSMNKNTNEKDCVVPVGQQALEAIFGTTITRGLKQVFDPDQYEGCGFDGEFKVQEKCVSMNGAKLKVGDWNNEDAKRNWYYDSKDSVIHSMVNYNKCWDSPDGKSLRVWDCNGTDAQKFVFDSETRQISLKSATDKCLKQAGASVAADTCAKGPAQQFFLKRTHLSDAGLTCDFSKRRAADCPP